MCPRWTVALGLVVGLVTCLGRGAAHAQVPGAEGPGAASSATNHEGRWRIRAGAAWIVPDGAIRLVRGTRKVVTTDAGANLGLGLDIEYRAGRRIGVSLGLLHTTFDYTHREAFTVGGDIETTVDLRFTALLGGVTVHLFPDRRVDVYLGAQASYVLYGDELNLFSERTLPAAPDAPPDPEPFDLAVDDDVGFGLVAGVDVPLGGRGLFLGAEARLLVSRLQAAIINDPEDDGEDVDLQMNPLGVGLRLGYRF